MKYLPPQLLWYFLKLAGVFVAYYVTARIGISFDAVGGFATLFWPPSGIALAAILIFGYRYWPAIFFAAFLFNYHIGAQFWVAAGIAAGNTSEALLAGYLLKNYIGFKNSISRVRDVLGLSFLAGMLCTTVGASVGSSSLMLGGIIEPVNYDETWLAWWIGDMLGIIVVTPLILIWSRKPQSFSPKRLLGAILLALLLTFVSLIIFRELWWGADLKPPYVYLIFPVLTWIALAYRQRGSVTGIFLVMIFAIWSTAQGLGPFANGDLSLSLLHLQSYIAVIAITFMIMAATVSQHRKIAAQLSESETRFRDIADTAPDIIWVSNENGDFTYLSKAWTSFTGLKKRLLSKVDWLTRITPKKRKYTNQIFSSAHAQKIPFNIRYRLKNRKGVYRWVMHSGVPKFDIEGNFEGLVGTIADIEDVLRGKRSEERARQLALQRAELVALNKAKDEFIAIASHQLRTPATGVKQYVGMLLEGFSGDITVEQRSYLQRAYENNERQIKIINDLLGVAMVDAENKELDKRHTDLAEVVQECIRSTHPTLSSKNQSIILKKSKSDFRVNIDKDKVKMAIENLIDNASKYSYQDTEIIVKLKANKHNATILVTDKGVGIHKKDFDKLFKKFSRLDNLFSVPVGGTGLGLYWVKKIVDMHGGKVAVRSKHGSGSTFTVTIPRNI